jgi:hypothetical protein
MKLNIETILIVVNLLIFVLSPFLPNVFYNYFVETYFGATILLLLALYSVCYGYLVAVSSFTSIASLYSESHARKARKVKSFEKASQKNEFETQLQASEPILPNEEHPEIYEPPEEKVNFLPKNDDQTNEFKAVDTSIDQKQILPTVSLSKNAEELYIKDNLAEKLD